MSDTTIKGAAEAPPFTVVANDALWLLRFMAGAVRDEWLDLPSKDQRKAWRAALERTLPALPGDLQAWIMSAPDLARQYPQQLEQLPRGDKQQLRETWAQQLRSFSAAFPELAALSCGTEIPVVVRPVPRARQARGGMLSSYLGAQQRRIAEIERTDPARAERMREKADDENARYFTGLQNKLHQGNQMINSNIQYG
jgi:hypothetical protein